MGFSSPALISTFSIAVADGNQLLTDANQNRPHENQRRAGDNQRGIASPQDRPAGPHCRADQLQRNGQASHQEINDRLSPPIRHTELAVRRVDDETAVLDRQRLIETKRFPDRRSALRGVVFGDHHVDRIADEAEQRERDQRHREHHHDGLQQAADNEGEHSLLVLAAIRVTVHARVKISQLEAR